LLHEAAHALAHVRGIKDTSRQGRWHNARFKALAEEVGIEVSKDDRLGWSPTAIPTATRETYAEVIAELGRVLRLFRSVEITGGGKDQQADPTDHVRMQAHHPRVAQGPRRGADPLRGVRGRVHHPGPPTTTIATTRTTARTATTGRGDVVTAIRLVLRRSSQILTQRSARLVTISKFLIEQPSPTSSTTKFSFLSAVVEPASHVAIPTTLSGRSVPGGRKRRSTELD